jgi:hypothetical protein
MVTYTFTLFADYFQFYLQDEQASDDLTEAWTESTVRDLLALGPATIAVGTVRNMDVPVTVEVHDHEPVENIEQWDHVNECDINVPSGKIVIAGCTDYFAEAARIEVKPGNYRARICYGDLDSLSDDGLDGDDHYKVALWLSDPGGFRVVKSRSKRD